MTWKVVHDGPSLAMLMRPDGRIYRLQELAGQGWTAPGDNDQLCEQVCSALSETVPSDIMERLAEWERSMGVMCRRWPSIDPGFVAIWQDMQRALAGRPRQSAPTETRPTKWSGCCLTKQHFNFVASSWACETCGASNISPECRYAR